MTNKFLTNCFRILDFSALATLTITFWLTQQFNIANVSLIAYLSANFFQRSRDEKHLTHYQNTLENLKQNATSLIDQNSQRIERLDQVIVSLPEHTVNKTTAYQSFNVLNQKIYKLTGRIDSLETEIPSINDTLVKLDENFMALLEGKANQQDLISLKEKVSTFTDQINTVQLTLNQLQQECEKLDQNQMSNPELLHFISEHTNFQKIHDQFTSLVESKVSYQDFMDLTSKVDKLDHLTVQVPSVHNELKQLQQYYQELDNSKISELELVQLLSELKELIDKKVSYELISGRSKSRELLIKALKEAKEQVILVCPWLTKSAINKEIRDLIQEKLYQGVNIKIGWGCLSNLIHKNNNFTPLPTDLSVVSLLEANPKRSDCYRYLQKLSCNEYRGKLTLKLLGTHEKYLICDHQYAMIGSHNFLASDDRIQELEVGLKTTHIQVIKQLIKHFNDHHDYTLSNRQTQRQAS